jgi:hypothetical protein
VNTHSLSQPRLPANRAFVVQFQVAAPGSTEAVHGRAEHMVSGKATHFASWVELEAFIEQVLTTVEERPP